MTNQGDIGAKKTDPVPPTCPTCGTAMQVLSEQQKWEFAAHCLAGVDWKNAYMCVLGHVHIPAKKLPR